MQQQARTHVEGARSSLRSAVARAAMRVLGSRFAKPVSQAALAAAGLVVLALIGRSASGSGSGSAPAALQAAAAASAQLVAPPPHAEPAAPPSPVGPRADDARPNAPSVPPGAAGGAVADPSSPPRTEASHAATALPDDPVVLNSASEADLRRLPGIGAKRADAILALRARLGRFRAIEDLLKVRGIGRATLKRLRPMVRLDAAATDGGAPRGATAPSP